MNRRIWRPRLTLGIWKLTRDSQKRLEILKRGEIFLKIISHPNESPRLPIRCTIFGTTTTGARMFPRFPNFLSLQAGATRCYK